MPLPSWVAEAADKLAQTENLVLLEGRLGDRPVVCVARYTYVPPPQNRIEFQILAVLRDADLDVEIDPGTVTLYPLVGSAVPVIEISDDEQES